MRYLQIWAAAREVRPVNVDDIKAAYPFPRDTNVDHGSVMPGWGIVVWEYSLTRGGDGPWFSIGRQLFGGNALLYRFNHAGETVDAPEELIPGLMFYRDRNEVETAISCGLVDRPRTAINDVTIWEWNRGA